MTNFPLQTSVGNAVISLEKHHSASLLQTPTQASKNAMHSVALMLKEQLRIHDNILGEVISPHQRKMVASLLHAGSSLVQSPEDYFAAVAAVGVHLPKNMAKFIIRRWDVKFFKNGSMCRHPSVHAGQAIEVRELRCHVGWVCGRPREVHHRSR